MGVGPQVAHLVSAHPQGWMVTVWLARPEHRQRSGGLAFVAPVSGFVWGLGIGGLGDAVGVVAPPVVERRTVVFGSRVPTLLPRGFCDSTFRAAR